MIIEEQVISKLVPSDKTVESTKQLPLVLKHSSVTHRRGKSKDAVFTSTILNQDLEVSKTADFGGNKCSIND